MFKRYAIRPQIVKIDKQKKADSKNQTPTVDPKDIIDIIEVAEAAAKDLTILVVGAVAAVIAMKTASEVIVNYAPKN